MAFQYTVINASAGSGKTYTLVQRVLMLCLKTEQRDAIRHILALTFTNKAANEMKERIIGWLKDFTQPDYESNDNLLAIKKEFEKEGVRLTMKDLHFRSQRVLNYILHHYSTLNIGTIDKFNSRLVRSFSYELGLPHQFSLEIETDSLLIEAIDKMLDQIGEDPLMSDAFMDFVNYNLDNEKRINISGAMYEKAKSFLSDIHYQQLKDNEKFDWIAYENAKKILRNEIREHQKSVETIAQESLQMIKNRGLENADFAGGGNQSLNYFFENVLQKGEPKLYKTIEEEHKKIDKYLKVASTKGKAKQHLIEEILDQLLENRQEIIRHYIKKSKKEKILAELLPLKINKEIQEKLNEIESENDLVLLSKFNVMINENLKNEPSNFIYEKIGTQYQHFFFDEFQDTSKMQWENIIPLRDNAITSEGNSFTLVGDPKQSIYRFRGGDSDLMIDILNGKEATPVPVNAETLDQNYRSAQNIVSFNNDLYRFMSKDLRAEHCDLFSDKAVQNAKKKITGRVRVSLAENANNEELYNAIAEQMHRNIQACIDNGFRLSDITILCRAADEIRQFSQLLGQKKIHYNGAERNIKVISEKGLTLDLSYTLKALIEFLRWEIQPRNKQFLVKALYYLKELGRVKMLDFSKEITELLSLETIEEFLKVVENQYGIKLRQQEVTSLNLYNYIEFFVREFSVEGKETDFLLNFLEMLYNFTQNSGLTIKDFVKYWEEEAHKKAIQASENIDAVKMMTIHASKGLQFEVVFLPMKNESKDNRFSDWFGGLGDIDGLKSVYTNRFSEEFGTYDTDIANFNEENVYKNKIDRYCIQYVATTRPVQQLFLYLEKPTEKTNNLEIYDFVQQFAPEDLDEFDLYPEDNHSFQNQHRETKKEHQKSVDVVLTPKNYQQKNITIATPSKNYQQTKESVRMGIFVHEILEKIITANDVEKVLGQYLLSGTITQNECHEIRERLTKVITDERYASYFAEGVKVINEKEIMVSENGKAKVYRPDRMVETSDGLVVIDFKTGAENEKYEAQVELYQSIMETMGRAVAGTEIIYV